MEEKTHFVAFMPAIGVSEERLLLSPAHEFAKSKTESCGQSIGDLNSHIHLAQLDGADVCAVHMARPAKSSWESPSFSRAKRIALPKVRRHRFSLLDRCDHEFFFG